MSRIHITQLMDFLLPTPEVKEAVRKEFGLNDRRIKEAVDGIKKWLELQPHLPYDDDDERLERWLIRCKNNMEKTKETLDMYYTAKTLSPEIMTGWDVDDPLFKPLATCTYGFLMPNLTPEYDRVFISGFFPTNLEPIDDWLIYKLMLMTYEVRMCEDYYKKDIMIYDVKNFTLGQLAKFRLPTMKKFMVMGQRGYNVRIRSIHFVNSPPFAEQLTTLVKKFMKKKIADRVHVHGTDLKELHNQIPKNCLPVELGGNCGTIQEHKDVWGKKLQSYREWFQKQEKLTSDESKRPTGRINSSDLFGFDGSFRQLSID